MNHLSFGVVLLFTFFNKSILSNEMKVFDKKTKKILFA